MAKITPRLSTVIFGILSLTTASVATAVTAPIVGKPAYNSKTDTGLYVWQEPAGDWRLSLVSGENNQEFSGVIEASRPFNSVKGIALEADDTINQTTPGKLEIDIQTISGRQDGIAFTIPANTRLCLRGSDRDDLPVYLGPKATPVNTPVNLATGGSCDLKYHPGHYIAMNGYDTQADMITAIQPGVNGVNKRYAWKELESAPGVYDFSAIESDLTLLADHGAQLVVLIEDKTFSAEKPTPDYLDEYTLPNRVGGYTTERWDPYVVGRMSALIRKLGERFDGNPNFEGVAIQESALSLTDKVQKLHGYTPEKYRDALTKILIDARTSLPTSQVFWYMNFLDGHQSYIADIANAVESSDIVMGGPDILPDAWTLTTNTYPFYDQFQGKLRLFGSMQYDSYAHVHKITSSTTGKYWTMNEMFKFARDDLHTNYIFWTRKTKCNPEDSYNWVNALPVIANNPEFNR